MKDEMVGVGREATDHVMEAALSFGGIQWLLADRVHMMMWLACQTVASEASLTI
jgi:hypothetical protein